MSTPPGPADGSAADPPAPAADTRPSDRAARTSDGQANRGETDSTEVPGGGQVDRGAADSAGVVGGGQVDRGAADSAGVVGGEVSAGDRAVVGAQLGRVPRAMRAVAHRCPCGLPDVVETAPRLPDGTPFPTLYYLTCPRAAAGVGRLEASGVMREMADRLRSDPELASGYRAAHEAYLRRRAELGQVPEIDGVSAGGMPTRVKCLHALLGHALAAGRGVNPLGDEVRDALPPWWAAGPCVPAGEAG